MSHGRTRRGGYGGGGGRRFGREGGGGGREGRHGGRYLKRIILKDFKVYEFWKCF